MKKFVSAVLAAVLVLCTLIPSYAEGKTAQKLQFNDDGSFRIMQISDIQDGTVLTPATKTFLEEVVIEAKPDVIVLTGDNISAGSATIGIKAIDLQLVKNGINNYMSVFEELGVPVALVFGNHDAEEIVTKEEQMEIYLSYDNCLAIDEGEALYGCGTYNVPIYSSANSEKIAYNLWMIDSNMYDETNGGYDYVHKDQIDWYVNKSNELKAQNGDVPVPSMMFQHIIVPEIYDALLETPNASNNSVERGGKHYILDPDTTRAGELNESPCPSDTNSGQFDAVVNQGDVVAMFFGHDHKNTFETAYRGVDLINSPTSGFGSYGDHNRGVRIIDIKENSKDYETSLITYLDFYADNKYMLAQYDLYGNEFGVGEKIVAFFECIIYGFLTLIG